MKPLRELPTVLLLPALIAGIGFTAPLGAVEISNNGSGGAVFVPFYSAAGSNVTVLSLHSVDSSSTQAIKIVVENDDGAPVAAFNLYLPGNQTWAAAIRPGADGTELVAPGPGCEVVENAEVGEQVLTGLPSTGRISIVQMGELGDVGFLGNDDCGRKAEAWQSGGAWNLDPNNGIDEPEGTLFVQTQIIDGARGTAIAIPNLVLQDFSDKSLHEQPDSSSPNLSSANSAASEFDNGAISRSLDGDGNVVEADWRDGEDAVTALLLKDSISSLFSVEPEINAIAEWVLSFPTIRYYQDELTNPAPFSMGYLVTDRDGGEGTPPCPIIMLPLPCSDDEFFVSEGILSVSSTRASLFGIESLVSLEDASREKAGNSGRLELFGFANEFSLESGAGAMFYGLPVIVTPVQNYTNGTLDLGAGQPVQANFSSVMQTAEK